MCLVMQKVFFIRIIKAKLRVDDCKVMDDVAKLISNCVIMTRCCLLKKISCCLGLCCVQKI